MRSVRLLASLLLALPIAWLGAPADPEPAEEVAPGEDVVLLHGLGRSHWNMRRLEGRLGEAGFRTHNLDYPSTDLTPAELVAHVDAELARCCARTRPLHFVTHSMGGILLRAYLAEHELPGLGRVVMLAPPNRGSEYVDVAGGWKVFGHLLGPTAQQLGTDPGSLPNRLPPPAFELGVIAGTGSLNPLGALVIEGANDGTVSVESARIPGMRDFLELDVSHTFIVRDAEVARQAIVFLRSGAFVHDE